MPSAHTRWGAQPAISRSRRRIEPPSGTRAPVIRLKSVVLPDPLGPMTPISSPSATAKLTSLTARTPPNAFETRSTSRRVSARPLGPSPLPERRRRIDERRGGGVPGPDQLLLAVDPLDEHGVDDAGAVRAELHGTDDRRRVGRRDGVADSVAVERARLADRRGEDLHTRVGGPGDRIGGASDLLLVRLVQLLDARRLEGVMPPRAQHDVVAVPAEVLRPDRRVGGADEEQHLWAQAELLHLLDHRHPVRRRREPEHEVRVRALGLEDQIGEVLGPRRVLTVDRDLVAGGLASVGRRLTVLVASDSSSSSTSSRGSFFPPTSTPPAAFTCSTPIS